MSDPNQQNNQNPIDPNASVGSDGQVYGDPAQPIQPYDYGDNSIQPYNPDPTASTDVTNAYPTYDQTYDPNAYTTTEQTTYTAPIDPNASFDTQAYQYDPNQQALDPYYGYETTTTTTTARSKTPFLLIGAGALLLLVLVGGLALILGNRPRTNTNNNNNTGKNIILQWWGAYIDSDVIKPLIDEYQTLNPNVKIEYANKVPNNVDSDSAKVTYRNELNRVLNTNDPVQLPDIFMVENTWVGDYEPYTQPSTVIDFNTFQNAFYPAVITDFANKGIVFGVPLWIDTIAVVFNKDFLGQVQEDTPPDEWFDFKETAQNLTRYNGNQVERSGFAFGDVTNTPSFFEAVLALLRQNGVDLYDSTGKPVFAQSGDAPDAFEFFKSFVGTNNPTWNSNFTNDAAAFLEQRTAMIVATSSRLREIVKYNDAASLGLEIGVSALPQLDSESEPIYWATYWGNMVAKNRPNSVAAWQFLNWLSQPEQLKKLHTNVQDTYGYFGTLYPRKDMSGELESDQYLGVYNSSLPNAETWYMIKGIEVKQIFADLLANANVSDSAITQAEEAVQELITLKGILQQVE